jgi:hypothetical protein
MRLKVKIHRIRNPQNLANGVVMQEPEAGHGEIKRGRLRTSYLDT